MEKESVAELSSIEMGRWVERNSRLKDFSFVAAFGGKNLFASLYVFTAYF